MLCACRLDYLLLWFWIDVAASLPLQCMLTAWAPDVVWWNLGYLNRRVTLSLFVGTALTGTGAVLCIILAAQLFQQRSYGC